METVDSVSDVWTSIASNRPTFSIIDWPKQDQQESRTSIPLMLFNQFSKLGISTSNLPPDADGTSSLANLVLSCCPDLSKCVLMNFDCLLAEVGVPTTDYTAAFQYATAFVHFLCSKIAVNNSSGAKCPPAVLFVVHGTGFDAFSVSNHLLIMDPTLVQHGFRGLLCDDTNVSKRQCKQQKHLVSTLKAEYDSVVVREATEESLLEFVRELGRMPFNTPSEYIFHLAWLIHGAKIEEKDINVAGAFVIPSTVEQLQKPPLISTEYITGLVGAKTSGYKPSVYDAYVMNYASRFHDTPLKRTMELTDTFNEDFHNIGAIRASKIFWIGREGELFDLAFLDNYKANLYDPEMLRRFASLKPVPGSSWLLEVVTLPPKEIDLGVEYSIGVKIHSILSDPFTESTLRAIRKPHVDGLCMSYTDEVDTLAERQLNTREKDLLLNSLALRVSPQFGQRSKLLLQSSIELLDSTKKACNIRFVITERGASGDSCTTYDRANVLVELAHGATINGHNTGMLTQDPIKMRATRRPNTTPVHVSSEWNSVVTKRSSTATAVTSVLSRASQSHGVDNKFVKEQSIQLSFSAKDLRQFFVKTPIRMTHIACMSFLHEKSKFAPGNAHTPRATNTGVPFPHAVVERVDLDGCVRLLNYMKPNTPFCLSVCVRASASGPNNVVSEASLAKTTGFDEAAIMFVLRVLEVDAGYRNTSTEILPVHSARHIRCTRMNNGVAFFYSKFPPTCSTGNRLFVFEVASPQLNLSVRSEQFRIAASQTSLGVTTPPLWFWQCYSQDGKRAIDNKTSKWIHLPLTSTIDPSACDKVPESDVGLEYDIYGQKKTDTHLSYQQRQTAKLNEENAALRYRLNKAEDELIRIRNSRVEVSHDLCFPASSTPSFANGGVSAPDPTETVDTHVSASEMIAATLQISTKFARPKTPSEEARGPYFISKVEPHIQIWAVSTSGTPMTDNNIATMLYKEGIFEKESIMFVLELRCAVMKASSPNKTKQLPSSIQSLLIHKNGLRLAGGQNRWIGTARDLSGLKWKEKAHNDTRDQYGDINLALRVTLFPDVAHTEDAGEQAQMDVSGAINNDLLRAQMLHVKSMLANSDGWVYTNPFKLFAR